MKPVSVDSSARPITGRQVLIAFIAFFAVVGGVNAIMIRFATSTFGGVEADRAYQVGLAYHHEMAAAASQNALGWNVQAEFSPQGTGSQLTVRVRDAQEQAPAGVRAVAHLGHPGDRRRNRDVPLSAASPGVFKGSIENATGQWDLVLEIWHDDQRMFRSVSRNGLR